MPEKLRQLGLALQHDQTAQSAALSALVGRRVSPLAARQLLAGEPITALADRQRLGGVLNELTGGQKTSRIALLLPAVQAAREAARSSSPLQELGLSAMGATQVASWLPISLREDRKLLATLLIAALGRPTPGGGGGNDILVGGTGRDRL